jgi:hypothetical protein
MLIKIVMLIAALTLSMSLSVAVSSSDDEWVENTPALIVGLIDENAPPQPCKAGECLPITLNEMMSVDDWVSEHNKYRCMHGVPDLTWSSEMAVNAQAWADAGNFQHSDCYNLRPPLGPAGENLAAGQASIASAVSAWYNEVSDCVWPGCQQSTGGAVGHFTAMIWKGAQTFGCGVNPTGWRGRPMYVCQYKGGDSLGMDTPNMGGGYESNVLQASVTESQCASGNSNSGGGSTPTPPTPPTPPPPPPSPPSGGSCTDGWNGCTGWLGLCGQGYTMQGSSQTLDDFCCATCS